MWVRFNRLFAWPISGKSAHIEYKAGHRYNVPRHIVADAGDACTPLFGGADDTKFDHDNDGRPGGSRRKRTATKA